MAARAMDAATSPAEERFELWRRRVGMILAPLVGIGLWLAPLPLAEKAHVLAAVFGFTIILWMTEAVPMAVASVLGPLLLVIGGVGTMDKIFAPFAHPIIFLFLGSFLLAEAMQKHGLDRRLALTLMALPGVASSPGRMLAALGLITAVLSMWMSNTAITAVMLPILMGVFRAQPELAQRKNLAAGLVLMVAFAASIGGMATPVGTPTNLVALGQLERFGLPRPSFAEWMRLGVPLMIVLLVVLWVILRPRETGGFAELAKEFQRQRAGLPGLARGEKTTALVFFIAVSLWLYPGIAEFVGGANAGGTGWMKTHLPEEAIGIGAGLLLFMLPIGRGNYTLEWRDTARVEWGVLLLFGGGFALGQQIRETGLSEAIGHGVSASLGRPDEGVLIAVAILVSVLLSEATSNTASANVMVPLMIGVAQSTGADPGRVAVATCLACSLGFMLPISTPPNALAYGTGYVRLPQMIKYGLVLDIAGGVAVWVVVKLLL
jgi:solute carrier family 13 (sodium-dependent dicarboxylate transporter), member 2/3/5